MAGIVVPNSLTMFLWITSCVKVRAATLSDTGRPFLRCWVLSVSRVEGEKANNEDQMWSCAVFTCSKRQPLCWGFCLPTGMSMAARNINILDVSTKREIILMGMWPQLEPGVCHRLHHFHRWQSKQDQAILLGSPWKSEIFAPKKWPIKNLFSNEAEMLKCVI